MGREKIFAVVTIIDSKGGGRPTSTRPAIAVPLIFFFFVAVLPSFDICSRRAVGSVERTIWFDVCLFFDRFFLLLCLRKEKRRSFVARPKNFVFVTLILLDSLSLGFFLAIISFFIRHTRSTHSNPIINFTKFPLDSTLRSFFRFFSDSRLAISS